MEVWGVLACFALAVSAVYTEPELTFPEIARERSSRIVSGWEAEAGQFPFQLSLRMVSPIGAVSSCGGTIISAEWGLTAAHCTASRESFVLRAGVVNLTRPFAIFETTKFYNHPEYDNSRPAVVQPHDIGLLEFGRSLEFNELVQPIRIQRSQSQGFNYDGIQLVASGWGRTWTNGAAPENLNWVYLLGDSHARCQTFYPTITVDSTICASAYNVSSQSTCQGDSGGPLTVVDDDGAISQIGVTSFVSGTGCHTPFPAGFIQAGYYHDWYLEVTGVNFDWEYDVPTSTAGTTTVAEEEEEDCEDEDDDEEDCEDEDDDEEETRHSVNFVN